MAAAKEAATCRSRCCGRASAACCGWRPPAASARSSPGLSGRVALPAAYAGARRARVPFVLWATIWAHPRTAAHALSYLPLRHLYRNADAIATYGPHVSAYVRGQGRPGPVVEAPQSVDDAFWSAPARPDPPCAVPGHVCGPIGAGKGCSGASSGLAFLRPVSTISRAGSGRRRSDPSPGRRHQRGYARRAGRRRTLRDFYAGSDVVVLPSIPTRDFREPWGLVTNEAFNQGVPVIATDAVGAAAGGLIEHERTGLVVPAGDAEALAGALRRLHDDPALRDAPRRRRARRRAAYTHDAWAAGMARALAAAGAGRSGGGC